MSNIKTISLAIIALIFASCSDESKHTKSLTEFQEFAQSIPLLKSGYVITCSTQLNNINTKSNFLPEGASLIGRLTEIDTIHSFIIYAYPADVSLPILEVYNSDGRKINEVTLLDLNSCASLIPMSESRFIIDNESEITFQELKIENASIIKSTTIKKIDLLSSNHP